MIQITAPLGGTVHRMEKGRAAKNCVEIGTEVDFNTVVCYIECMEHMYPINSGVPGIITEILACHRQAVGHGQLLFNVRPR